ncbi:WGR domain-containing protein (plasmid) [Rhizobium etli 8C-3]|uniref:WGR domain-containing protein n=8 Tax=Rhizobium TaxID=379 RepID=A0A1L5PB79_RHIET|nr:WGR domain-containing protein [Rhizobium etli 8C-3]
MIFGFNDHHKNESVWADRFISVVRRKSWKRRLSVMLTQPYQLYIERRDATKNMARFYALAIEPTLFGTPCLTRRWGRIGTIGQAMVHHFDREEDAVRMFLELLRSKRARGYRPNTNVGREPMVRAVRGSLPGPCR